MSRTANQASGARLRETQMKRHLTTRSSRSLTAPADREREAITTGQEDALRDSW